MVNSLSKFVSTFNYGYSSRKRFVFVPNTSLIRSSLSLLRSEGYILAYTFKDSRTIGVYYNFSISPFKFRQPSSTTKQFVTVSQLRSLSNSGKHYIIKTNAGLIFSKFCLLNKQGGSIILELNNFLFFLRKLY
jgi:ribosomal protein S8